VLLLLDWNGTVVDDTERAFAATNEVLAGHRLMAVERDQFAATFRLPLLEMFRDLGVAEGELAAATGDWNAAMARGGVSPRRGAAAALAALRDDGAQLGVISAASANALDADLRDTQLREILHSIEVGVADKVAALIARRTERRRAVYVGDTEYDMSSAVAADFIPIGIAGGYCTPARLTAAGAVAVIEDLDEIRPLLAGTELAALN
jgi:phosphoglycolate phosphatase